MKVELIPVIEIRYSSEEIALPEKGPYWAYAAEWEQYREACCAKAGFSERFKPYVAASSFYKLSEITEEDLLKIIEKEIEVQQTEDELGVDDVVCALSGGYVLRVDEQDVYFPQCCGDLADVRVWEDLCAGNSRFFFAGHPSPKFSLKDNCVVFDFVKTDTGEPFAPPVPVNVLEIDVAMLQHALADAKKELDLFGERLVVVNETFNLQIKRIREVLIYGDSLS